MAEWPKTEGQARRLAVGQRLAGKKTKEAANYRPQNNMETTETCNECKHYEKPGEKYSSCRKVVGLVKGDDVCDLYKARAENSPTAQPTVVVHIEVKGK